MIKYFIPSFMKIIVYSPIPYDGTSFYRAFGPFNNLQRRYNEIEIINGSDDGFEYSWRTLGPVDIVFLQRPSTSIGLQIIKTAKRCNKPVWIDYDDDYINIPVSNPRHELYANTVRQSQTMECMKLADVITVSTQSIADSIADNINTKARVIVVPNAFDPYLFDSSNAYNELPKNKFVLWRGGDTHVKDVELYKDAILECFDKHKQYTWIFYGHEFDWITQHAISRNEWNRIRLYEFTDLMQYFKNCMQLRPEIMIVPLEDNAFNRAKSNISFIEGTLFGASVMATGLPEFEKFTKDAIELFNTKDEFVSSFNKLVENPLDIDSALRQIPSLDMTNRQRMEIAISLKSDTLHQVIPITEIWDDKRFFEYACIHGYIQDNPEYTKGHHSVADWLIETIKPETMIEFGCGPGAMLERFLMNNVESLGIEINPYFIDYFQSRNPVLSDRITRIDFTKGELEIAKTDLCISIEVFEHIDMPNGWWDGFLRKLAKSCKFFYFSSTQYRASIQFDIQWGHVNVRPSAAWIKLFEANGWIYKGNPRKICNWDMLFESSEFAE